MPGSHSPLEVSDWGVNGGGVIHPYDTAPQIFIPAFLHAIEKSWGRPGNEAKDLAEQAYNSPLFGVGKPSSFAYVQRDYTCK